MIRRVIFFVIICLLNMTHFSWGTSIPSDVNVSNTDMELFYLTSDKELVLGDVINSNQFKLLDKETKNLGIQTNSIWIKAIVTNYGTNHHLIFTISYPILNEVSFFQYTDSVQKFTEIKSGESTPFSQRKFQVPYPVFDLDITTGTTQTYYIRVKSTEQILLPITISDSVYFWDRFSTENLMMGIYMGLIAITIIYNFFILFAIRDFNYLYYILYVLFLGLTHLGIEGYSYLLFWPESPKFASVNPQFFACVCGLFAIIFAHKYLRVKKFAPKTHFLFIILGSFFIISAILLVAGVNIGGFIFMQTTTILACFLGLAVSYYIMKKKYTPAKYFFIAWFVFLMSSILFLFKDFGILPYNFFTKNLVKIGSSFEIALLSLGLANRINVLKNERDKSRIFALTTARKNEEIIKGQNLILERKVKERTEALSSTNDILQKALNDLKETQTQLVTAEKMTSLGQLTAGIAHEINNPINFVAGNVNPLERDIQQLLSTIDFLEETIKSKDTLEQKIDKIAYYKKESEHDYVIQEIDFLLKGIKEGASRTATIVKSLRTFSREDGDHFRFANINEGIESTLTIANNIIQDVKVEKLLEELPMITCNPGKLNQVFLNIITNGIFAIHQKFKETQGKGGLLTIATLNQSNHIEIIIKDNGIGMSEEVKSKIFNPFFTTKDVGEGTGLGMSIVFRIIEEHKGNIEINSKQNLGTEFKIHIPK